MQRTKLMNKFTHLHVHSEYSLLDGLIRIDDLLGKVKEYGMDSVALTDHGVMYGTYEFWSHCKEAGIKPIIGVEAYIAARSRFDKVPKIDDKRYHIVLLARTREGYQNLLKLVSLSQLEGYYYFPRIDKELIAKYGKGLIGTSACLSGIVNSQLYNNREKEAAKWAEFLKKSLDEFYIEIQRNGMRESEDLIPKQIKFSRKYSLPLLATCDSHYIQKEDWYVQEVLWAIRDGKKLEDDTRRRSSSEEFYIKSPDEVIKLYRDIPEAVENSVKISKKIESYDIVFDRIQPKYNKLPHGKNVAAFLKELTLKGAKERYGKLTDVITSRINYELKLIHDKGYDDYFLVVYDYVNWAMNNGILIGPGRGSGAGSAVSYSLKITNLDPFKFELYFERFLNPERPSPPDFDIDFQDDRRDELFDYMTNTYGAKNTSFIGTFGRMKTRAAIRDVARVMDIDLEVADKLSKMVSVKFGKVAGIDDMLKRNAEFKTIIDSSPELKELTKVVRKIAGNARHVSTHACGYLVTPEPIVNYLPVQRESRGGKRIITQIEGYSLEPMGLMKFDFLGLKNLTIIKNTVNLIKRFKNIDIDMNKLPLDDKSTFKLFEKGETTAIFQFESDGMKKYLKELKPSTFEDLIFLAAAYRPGPMKYIPDYIARKYGKQKTEYLHPDLAPILEKTFGFAVYQEQVLRIAVEMAGYTLGAADILRRAMGKKKVEVMKAEKERFVKGCIAKGYTKKLGEQLFAYIEPFADYGFNRSHAACYALIAYQTAYLKTYFPTEFLAGLMETDLDASDKITRDILEAERMGIKVLPPHINKSDVKFTIEGEREIRFGLAAIKNVGTKIIEKIIQARQEHEEFNSLDELVARVGTINLNKKTLECLIKVGTMDQFGSRSALLEIMPQVVDNGAKIERQLLGGQAGLFDRKDKNFKTSQTPLPEIPIESERQKLEWEKELIGTFLSVHPLKHYQSFFGDTILTVSDAKKKSDNSQIKVGGLISRMKEIETRKGNKKMAFVNIEYYHEEMEAVFFNSVYEKNKAKLIPNRAYVFIGKISSRDGKKSLLVDEIKSFASFTVPKGETITLDVSSEKDPVKLKMLKQAIVDNPGKSELIIYYDNGNGKKAKCKLKSMVELNATVKKVIEPYITKTDPDS